MGSSQHHTDHHPGDYQVLRSILEGTAAHTGKSFFRALVRELATALHTKGAWVTEYLEEKRRLRALAFWMSDHFVEEYEYAIRGTPCETVVQEQQFFHIPENIIELFPEDPDLEPFEAVSYLGAPLLDLDGSVLGHLAVQDIRPMPKNARNQALFRIFADRAASELRRIRAEQQLQEREEQLSRLVDSAMDAIIEIDPKLTIIQANNAAIQLLEEGERQKMIHQSFERYLSPEAAKKLKNLVAGLQQRPKEKRYLWVPGGFQAVRADGEMFQSEATLSCYEQDRNHFYTLILRNVSDRIEAEKRIDLLSAETEYLRQEIREMHNTDDIIGQSPAMTKVRDEIRQVADTDATVLIHGETGTGKELVARAIHEQSQRSTKPLIKVNCAAIPEMLIESEFFGHKKGAFTGATESRKGRFMLADGGTIFLDEIGELSPELQPKLLRVLQEGEFEPVGSSETRHVDVRVVAATNRNLKQRVENGLFREDLYYRLHVFPIELPPLRERGEDVLLLAEAFIERSARRFNRRLLPLDNADKRLLRSYRWPGNIRELQNIIERAVITASDGHLNLSQYLGDTDLKQKKKDHTDTGEVKTAKELEQLERQNMIRALEATGWKVSGQDGAASLIGIPPTTFSSRMKALEIERPS